MKASSKPFFGVNLGGWFVVEKWLTPNLFRQTGTDDLYGFVQTPGAREKIRQHNREFIREQDFDWLAKHGVTHIRLPVGYWVLEADAPYVAAKGRLDWVFMMAKKYKLQILLDLHAAPGSQNGNDHSGRIGAAKWYDDKSYQRHTIRVLTDLARRYGKKTELWGIELLNEPRKHSSHRTLRQFYRDAYDALDPLLHPSVYIVFSDAFSPRKLSGALRGRRRAVLDVHWYHFTSPVWLPMSVYFWVVRRHGTLLRKLGRTQPVIIGEWSAALMEAKLRHSLTPGQRETLFQKHIELQLASYQQALGSFYWTYRADNLGTWDFRRMVESGRLKLPK